MDQISAYFGADSNSFEVLDRAAGDFLITHHNEQVGPQAIDSDTLMHLRRLRTMLAS